VGRLGELGEVAFDRAVAGEHLVRADAVVELANASTIVVISTPSAGSSRQSCSILIAPW